MVRTITSLNNTMNGHCVFLMRSSRVKTINRFNKWPSHRHIYIYIYGYKSVKPIPVCLGIVEELKCIVAPAPGVGVVSTCAETQTPTLPSGSLGMQKDYVVLQVPLNPEPQSLTPNLSRNII